MQKHATGTFEVKVVPLTAAETVEHGGLGRMSIDKQFSGDLVATSVGQMLASGGGVGAGAYVALEHVTGTLHGRDGSFVLMHHGTMTSTSMELAGLIVPETATGALVGLTGTFRIVLEGGGHAYQLDYTLPP